MNMSPRCPVLNLSFLCLHQVSNQITHALSDDQGQWCEDVIDYLRNVTVEVLQDLLNYVLRDECLDAGIRFSCIELLLRKDVKRLDTGIFPRYYWDKILSTIAENGMGLQHLNLKGVWVKEYPEMLCGVLENLKHLKVLIIPHMADDKVLEVAMECEHLTVLDISGDCNFTANGLRRLTSKSLRVLDIGNFGEEHINDIENTADILADMIENLPNLNILRTYSFIGKSILKLHERNPKFRSNLKYIHDTKTSPEICEAIVNVCPKLENFYFDTPVIIDQLKKLKHLNRVKLSRIECKTLHNFLEQNGSELDSLKVVRALGTLDLAKLCKSCPRLSVLECFKMNLTYSELSQTYRFDNLVYLEVLYSGLKSFVLKDILISSPNLKRLVIGENINMTDGDMYRLCAECSFKHLEELWFSCARSLTATAVELLMGHCPKLRVIGQLSGWDITPGDMEYLRAVIASTNTDLTLLPVGMFP